MNIYADDLLTWYDHNKRTLPWRAMSGEQPDPYRVWLSEIMLQQTTVATVKSYFEKFTTIWPTVQDLAAAPQEDILKEWAGLGYYARARNLHKCAITIAHEHNGVFPSTEAELKTLPGIGDYTAAAIAAIAFNEAAAVVDGNIERIISRTHYIETPLPKAKPAIKSAVKAKTPTDRPGDFAQAMMDLGATICRPKNPDCLLCPWQLHCDALKHGDMERFPVKPPKAPKPVRRAISFWVEHDGHVLLERRQDKGLLGGMPGFFSSPWVERNNHPTVEESLDFAPLDTEWALGSGIATHTFTHFHLETKLAKATAKTKINIENGFWHPMNDLKSVGLPTVFKKIAKLNTQ
ncbi:A/G-specific adenine glycosylase [Kordiimonas sp. SCSIO 12610]|uniref:A/G-specific adenine glycosylase n=1 Tax=Kordiimonas sp. SCSIO 12610 TaxID=2829597 RepID=UPI00210BD0E9|nr:A/G-specific adenine glycosylase [Kordiimonas sp. SCSIO 12610]UTW54501.1 A/G-specific adenine glycosylase [Kordiimonas sp. SCSIO 12610]